MSYEPKAQIIGRTSPSKFFSTTAGRDVHQLYNWIQSSLAQCGWSRAGATMNSGIMETWTIPGKDDYSQRIKVRMEKVVASAGNTSYIKFFVSDGRFFSDEVGVQLAASSDEYRFFGCPFQFIIRPKSVALGGKNDLLISMIRIPIFLRGTTYLSSVIALEAGRFFQQFAGTHFGEYAYVASVTPTGDIVEWRDFGTESGIPQYICLANDNLYVVNTEFELFAPAWVAWGINNKNSPARMQGFLWNTLNWYSAHTELYKTYTLSGEGYVSMIASHFNNTMMYRLS